MQYWKQCIIILLFLSFILPPGTVSSDISEPSETISLKQALSLALKKNPELAVVSIESEKAAAKTFQAGRLPNPHLSFEMENFAGTGGLKQSDAMETKVVISQVVQFGKKRVKHKKIAELTENLVQWDIAAHRVDIIKLVSTLFVEVLGAQELVKFDREIVRLEEEIYNTVSERVLAGKVSPLEEIKARANLASGRIELAKAEKSLQAGRKQLAATWGASSLPFKAVEGDLGAFNALPELEKFYDNASKNPDIARWDTELKRQRAVLALEKSRRFPDVEIGAGCKDFNESDDHAFSVGVTIPLVVFDRNRGNIREALQGLQQAEKERFAVRIFILTRLGTTYDKALMDFNEVTVLKKDIVPGTKTVFEGVREGYREGKFNYLDVLDAQRTFFKSKQKLIQSLVSLHKSVLELERLSGTQIVKQHATANN